jgi:transposase
MATQRRYSIEFKRQIVQEYQGGDTLHGVAKRHGISRNLVRIWAAKAEAGEFDDDLATASILQEYEARIGALERLVGKLALENEFLKGASRHARPQTSATTSVVAGPEVSRSAKDAG